MPDPKLERRSQLDPHSWQGSCAWQLQWGINAKRAPPFRHLLSPRHIGCVCCRRYLSSFFLQFCYHFRIIECSVFLCCKQHAKNSWFCSVFRINKQKTLLRCCWGGQPGRGNCQHDGGLKRITRDNTSSGTNLRINVQKRKNCGASVVALWIYNNCSQLNRIIYRKNTRVSCETTLLTTRVQEKKTNIHPPDRAANGNSSRLDR